MDGAGVSATQLRRTASGTSFETWEIGNNRLSLRWSARGALEVVVHGHGSGELTAPTLRRKDAVVDLAGTISLFYDFTAMSSYDSAMRVLWTQWIRAHMSVLGGVHVVASSKLVAMGVSVANLALGGVIQSYPQRKGAFAQGLTALGVSDR